MLYSVRGKLIYTSATEAVVECGGVGYQCNVPLSTLQMLPHIGSEVTLYTYLNVRENGIDLFGFSTMAETNCFKLLTSVSGVGPKVGIAILSELPPDKIMLSIISNDAKSLTRAAGVGPKLAQRIILELKDKAGKQELSQGLEGISEVMGQADGGGDISEAMAALVVLGYSQSEAAKAVTGFEKNTPVDQLIKGALKKLSRGGG